MPNLITDWRPEDPDFWEAKGKSIALRNLWISVPALLLAFIVWQLWSVATVYMPNVGFKYTPGQLMVLTALPALSGATLRVFYAFIVPVTGGRRWTVISTFSLLIPSIWLGIAIQDLSTPFYVMAIIALLCGFGCANFSSSMANIGYFFPPHKKGMATGTNAGLGNLGVSVIQFVTPFIIGVSIFGALGGAPQHWVHGSLSKSLWLQNIGYVWIPFLVISIVAAYFGMNDLATAKASFSEQAIIFKRRDNWLLCLLYLGAFGSFIGFSAALPLLIKREFPLQDPLTYAFIGPLLGSIFRVVGGSLSDKISPAKITQWSFILIIVSVLSIMYWLPSGDGTGNFIGFLLSFLILFVFVGLANGSIFAQVPVVFLKFHKKLSPQDHETALHNMRKESGTVLGFMGAIGAYGGFIIPQLNALSIQHTGSLTIAFSFFISYYVLCTIVNKWFYNRKNALC